MHHVHLTAHAHLLFLPARLVGRPSAALISGSTSGDALTVGWTEERLAKRQAEFDAGRKVDYRIDTLEIRVYGDTAVSTFERIGTIKEVEGTPQDSHMRITGVWIRTDGQSKLGHRHESKF